MVKIYLLKNICFVVNALLSTILKSGSVFGESELPGNAWTLCKYDSLWYFCRKTRFDEVFGNSDQSN